MKKDVLSGYTPIFPRCKVWISSSSEEGVFGDGKWRLLKELDMCHSIRAAAERLGMSYRKAWGDLKKAEACLNVKLIRKHRGGADGGETIVTEAGKAWIKAYEAFRGEIDKNVGEMFSRHIKKLIKEIEKS
ncbi:LysR family transcriptional regulator [Candidatus Sumerlaeota bacterium]|nr:LysR family transcriptional regulator [Candidatus Sumerlaeota bacterium]